MAINPDFTDRATLEKYSSTASLSDMEIYVFPELLYPLVLANIMSPILWKWRNDPWFENITQKSFIYKANRIKQFIMDHYVFNLDLETWGLTTKTREMERFAGFTDMEMIRQSNALFGYEGDKYYFDIKIRRHFGLDAYPDEVIPYWKTETVEAMTAFQFKDTFSSGAGECVSLSALYAATLFVVGRIPLEDIFLLATPLHSQNFVDVNEGLLTNNRRIVTKRMWFNGTSLSTKARRALEHEKVTLVSHLSGYIHHMQRKATINYEAYSRFSGKLREFLTTHLTPEIFVNFLRYHMEFKKCFQYRHFSNGHEYYIGLETIFEYEHNSRSGFSGPTRDALLNEIDDEEFSHTPFAGRIPVQDVEQYLAENKETPLPEIADRFIEYARIARCGNEDKIISLFMELKEFLQVIPRLPDHDRQFVETEILDIRTDHTRQEIMDIIIRKAPENELALLTLHTYRQMDIISWEPFIKASLERNPVSLKGLAGRSAEDAYALINALENESIYDGPRLSQPDEVWNFQRGDGVEKAILLANYLYNESSRNELSLAIDNTRATLKTNGENYTFISKKGLVKNQIINNMK